MSMTADEQLKQIAEVEEEIELMELRIKIRGWEQWRHVDQRILVSRQAALEELKRGCDERRSDAAGDSGASGSKSREVVTSSLRWTRESLL